MRAMRREPKEEKMGEYRLVVDTDSCIYGWGPCAESYNFSHACKRQRGHDGRHVCEICGATSVPAVEGTQGGDR